MSRMRHEAPIVSKTPQTWIMGESTNITLPKGLPGYAPIWSTTNFSFIVGLDNGGVN